MGLEGGREVLCMSYARFLCSAYLCIHAYMCAESKAP